MTKRRKKKSSKLQKAGVAGLTVGKWLLGFLGEMIELMPDSIEGRREYIRRLDGWPKEFPRHRIEQELSRMKKRGWIIEAEKAGKKFIKMTEKGRLEILYRKLSAFSRPRGKSWDGTWWMALFDIPERGRAERDAIRKALTTAGFYRLQKSVYIYPAEIPEEVIAYFNAKQLLSYIRFVHVDRMEGARPIENHFRLKKR